MELHILIYIYIYIDFFLLLTYCNKRFLPVQGSTSKRKLNVTIIFSLFQCDAVRPWKATYRSTETDRGYIKYSTELKVGIMIIIIIISPYWQSDQLQYYKHCTLRYTTAL